MTFDVCHPVWNPRGGRVGAVWGGGACGGRGGAGGGGRGGGEGKKVWGMGRVSVFVSG